MPGITYLLTYITPLGDAAEHNLTSESSEHPKRRRVDTPERGTVKHPAELTWPASLRPAASAVLSRYVRVFGSIHTVFRPEMPEYAVLR